MCCFFPSRLCIIPIWCLLGLPPPRAWVFLAWFLMLFLLCILHSLFHSVSQVSILSSNSFEIENHVSYFRKVFSFTLDFFFFLMLALFFLLPVAMQVVAWPSRGSEWIVGSCSCLLVSFGCLLFFICLPLTLNFNIHFIKFHIFPSFIEI